MACYNFLKVFLKLFEQVISLGYEIAFKSILEFLQF
jgi:hypothetical protein